MHNPFGSDEENPFSKHRPILFNKHLMTLHTFKFQIGISTSYKTGVGVTQGREHEEWMAKGSPEVCIT